MSSDASPDEEGATESLSSLLALLDLETIETNAFRGVSPKDRWQRVFGGQVLGQALVAAARTVEVAAVTRCMPIFCPPEIPKLPFSTKSIAAATACTWPRPRRRALSAFD